MGDREVLGEDTTSKEASGRVDKPLNKVQKVIEPTKLYF